MSVHVPSSTKIPIPIIDLSLPDHVIAADLHRVCTDHGFFFIINHDVPQPLITKTFSVAKQFFDLPTETKLEYIANDSNRGYTPLCDETLDTAVQTMGDTKEGFYIGAEYAAANDEATTLKSGAAQLTGANRWVADDRVPAFKSTMTDYYAEMTRVALRLVSLLWSAIHNAHANKTTADAHWIESGCFKQAAAFLRLLHYTPQKSSPADGIYGAGAHTDWDVLTILATDGQPGLQIQHSGEWIDVPHVQNAFVVNIADMLMRWTNDTYRSTVHRVLTTSEHDRYSIPFFFGPNIDTLVKVLDVCHDESRPLKYEPIVSGAYLAQKYQQTQQLFAQKNLSKIS